MKAAASVLLLLLLLLGSGVKSFGPPPPPAPAPPPPPSETIVCRGGAFMVYESNCPSSAYASCTSAALKLNTVAKLSNTPAALGSGPKPPEETKEAMTKDIIKATPTTFAGSTNDS